MILDTLAGHERYLSLHPLFPRAFAFLIGTDLRALLPGRIPLDGDHLYVSIDHVEGRGRDGARLEAHRRYADIQVTIAGDEVIGWRPRSSCSLPDGPFDESRDVERFADRPDCWLALPADRFAIFFPEDAHAPLAARGPVRKAIVKVALAGA